MLPDALKFERFGTIDQIQFLLEEVLSVERPQKLEEIIDFCERKSVSLSASLDAILSLLGYISLIEQNSNGAFARVQNGDIAKNDFHEQFVKLLLKKLSQDGLMAQFVSPESIEYDATEDAICVRNNLIPLDLSGLKNLLISSGFFKQHTISINLLRVNELYREFFETAVIPAIKEERFGDVQVKGLSLAALMRIQEMNEIHGKEAEQFVLSYERARVVDDEKRKRIRIISDIQCDAGYDIISFNDINSVRIDRFIEVKSYSTEVGFFWSRNEVRTAEIKIGKIMSS
jgi:mRNA-degrading endonuclease HigB of HigAB toxin-antitoxin module